ncbi:MAG: hypothetical protein ACE5M4_07035, partial [Anaerolineales bacterium]
QISTPIPTIGPGSRFEQGDPYLKTIDPDGIVGDSRYGYYVLPEDPDSVLIWTTDETGTHYLVVREDSEVLTGGSDPENGIYRLVQRREELKTANANARLDRDTHKETAGFLRGGTVLAWGAAIGCVIASAGACVLGLLGIGAAAFAASLAQDDDAGEQHNAITINNEQIADIEGQMRFQQKIGQSTEGSG